MTNYFKYIFLGTLLLSTSVVFFAQPTVFDRDQATPKPETPAWETERDLIVLFESSDDRVALALLVMNASLNANNTLIPQHRYDGLRIAGHTLYREGEYAHSATCFNGVIALDISDDATADAARMKAQSLVSIRQFDQAVDAYQLCDMLSRQIETVNGFHDLYRHTIMPYLQAAESAQNYDIAVSLIDEILQHHQKYQTTDADDVRTYALETGARMARKLGLNNQAANYLTTLLQDFPDYGLSFPGPRAKLQMDLVEAQGFSFEDKDPEAIEAAMNIVKDERFYGMPIWSYYVDLSARLLDENDAIQDANKLRLWAVDQLDMKHGSLPAGDPNTLLLQTAIRRSQADLLYRTANMYQKTRQTQQAVMLYQRIVDDFSDVTPEYADYSSRRMADLQVAP